MFYYLEGTVSVVGQNLAVIDAGGVGYACMTTTATLSRLEANKNARLYTYCYIKEDAFDIYGFFDLNEKRCFELLIGVSGVGPKAALSILSSCSPEALALAVIGDDETMLTRAPGIGKKLAQRVILELKDKVSKESSALKSPEYIHTRDGADEQSSKMKDTTAALMVLGFSQGEISVALQGIDVVTNTVEEIIKEVLRK